MRIIQIQRLYLATEPVQLPIPNQITLQLYTRTMGRPQSIRLVCGTQIPVYECTRLEQNQEQCIKNAPCRRGLCQVRRRIQSGCQLSTKELRI